MSDQPNTTPSGHWWPLFAALFYGGIMFWIGYGAAGGFR